MTYLLCVYLVFKGFEILQIGLSSARENRVGMILIGVLAVVIAFVAAAYFVNMIDAQANTVSSPTNGAGG